VLPHGLSWRIACRPSTMLLLRLVCFGISPAPRCISWLSHFLRCAPSANSAAFLFHHRRVGYDQREQYYDYGVLDAFGAIGGVSRLALD
jgi:hypothetical protein